MKTEYILESGSGNSNEDTMVLEKNVPQTTMTETMNKSLNFINLLL